MASATEEAGEATTKAKEADAVISSVLPTFPDLKILCQIQIVWKFQDFSIIKILREIKFWASFEK